MTRGAATVRAVVLASGPGPASLTAFTFTVTFCPLPSPPTVVRVSVTSLTLPATSTRYFVTGRPFSTAGVHCTATVPGWSATVDARSSVGAAGR